MENVRSSDAIGEVHDYINGAGHAVQCLFGFIFAIIFCIVYATYTHKLDLPQVMVRRKKTKDSKGLYHHIIIALMLPALLFCFFYTFALEYIIQMTPCLGL